jgi:hypothetical protein
MARRSPTLEGFRMLFRMPSLGLAEITWRWVLGAGFAACCAFAALQYLNSLPVSNTDLLMLRTRHPFMISRAIAHIMSGSGVRALAAASVLALTFCIAWIVVGAIGRAATLKALLIYYRPAAVVSVPLQSLVGLNILRVAVTLATLIGAVGAFVLAGVASPKTNPSPAAATLVFFLLLMLLGFCWSILNWFCSLAAVCAAVDGGSTFAALAQSAGLFCDRTGPIFAAGIWFGLAHVVAFGAATSVVAFPLAFAGLLPGSLVLGGVIAVTLAYSAVVDYLYVGRLAAYLYIAEAPDNELPEKALPRGIQPELFGGVDQDELIVSDLPLGDLPA